MSTRKSEIDKKLLREFNLRGIKAKEIFRGKHKTWTFTYNGQEHSILVSVTPRTNNRSDKNALADLRRKMKKIGM